MLVGGLEMSAFGIADPAVVRCNRRSTLQVFLVAGGAELRTMDVTNREKHRGFLGSSIGTIRRVCHGGWYGPIRVLDWLQRFGNL